MARATRKNTMAARQSRPSIVQKLCAQILTAGAAHSDAIKRVVDAETAADRAYPKPPKSIWPTKATLLDVPLYTGQQRAIPSNFIRSALTTLKSNLCIIEERLPGVRTFHWADKGFPLTADQKARVRRLESMLADAEKHERARAKVKTRFNLKRLDNAVHGTFKLEQKLILKLQRVRSASPHDILAKLAVYRRDPELFGVVFPSRMLDEVQRALAAR
jgi:hypothetical protein